MKVFGLTGGIASGKSAVMGFLQDYPLIEADDVSREVVGPGSVGLAQISEAFGNEVLQDDGTLDRAALRRTIAHSKDAQQRLNAIMHPLIIQTIMSRLHDLAEAGHSVAFVSAALMLETGSYRKYDGTLLVCAPESVRLARLLSRDGMEEATARALMAKQWPDEKKRELATVIIENDADLATLEARTKQALVKLEIVA